MFGECNDINSNHLERFTEAVTLPNGTVVDAGCQAEKKEWVSRRKTVPTPEISTSRITSPHGAVLRILCGTRPHLPFLSAGFSYSRGFYAQSEESSFVAVIAMVASSLLRTRQWSPITS